LEMFGIFSCNVEDADMRVSLEGTMVVFDRQGELACAELKPRLPYAVTVDSEKGRWKDKVIAVLGAAVRFKSHLARQSQGPDRIPEDYAYVMLHDLHVAYMGPEGASPVLHVPIRQLIGQANTVVLRGDRSWESYRITICNEIWNLPLYLYLFYFNMSTLAIQSCYEYPMVAVKDLTDEVLMSNSELYIDLGYKAGTSFSFPSTSSGDHVGYFKFYFTSHPTNFWITHASPFEEAVQEEGTERKPQVGGGGQEIEDYLASNPRFLDTFDLRPEAWGATKIKIVQFATPRGLPH